MAKMYDGLNSDLRSVADEAIRLFPVLGCISTKVYPRRWKSPANLWSSDFMWPSNIVVRILCSFEKISTKVYPRRWKKSC